MTFPEFQKIVEERPDGVVLLEGRRGIPASAGLQARELGRLLALRFPCLRFRSGNADGADRYFSEGVAGVDPGRLQIILPYAGHRQGSRYPDARYESPDSLPVLREDEVASTTIGASPGIKRLVDYRKVKGPMAAKAAYLMRDTMKVIGGAELADRPVCGLFYIDPADPMAGGTGHTIRVCRQEGVPVAFQDAWASWIGEPALSGEA